VWGGTSGQSGALEFGFFVCFSDMMAKRSKPVTAMDDPYLNSESSFCVALVFPCFCVKLLLSNFALQVQGESLRLLCFDQFQGDLHHNSFPQPWWL